MMHNESEMDENMKQPMSKIKMGKSMMKEMPGSHNMENMMNDMMKMGNEIHNESRKK